MDKVVIVGVFDFVNFHLCKALLNKGIEVRGVQIETEENEDILVEKRLEIGRNSNFTEVSVKDLTNKSNEKETIVLSVYDLYMKYKENVLQNDFMKNHFLYEDNWDQIIIIVPIQLLGNEIESEANVFINDVINRKRNLNKNIQYLYLPTIYGPWQPDTFMFQHSILAGMDKGKGFRGMREETNDALFVDDTVESIIEVVEEKGPGKYLLQSGKKDQWDLCAAFLRIIGHPSSERTVDRMENDIIKLTVNSSIPISEALTKQIDHTHRLYS